MIHCRACLEFEALQISSRPNKGVTVDWARSLTKSMLRVSVVLSLNCVQFSICTQSNKIKHFTKKVHYNFVCNFITSEERYARGTKTYSTARLQCSCVSSDSIGHKVMDCRIVSIGSADEGLEPGLSSIRKLWLNYMGRPTAFLLFSLYFTG